MRMLPRLFVILFLSVVAGCSTVHNLKHNPTVGGGLTGAVSDLPSATRDLAGGPCHFPLHPVAVSQAAYATGDVVFSAVGDLITAPYVMSQSR